MIETLIKYNEIFVQNNSHGNRANKNIFDFSNFGSNLILTAPHATRSFVGKKEKLADACTGALVKYIGEQNRISNIIRTKFVPHKALISDFIAENKLQNHYFLDIHGFVAEPKYDVCLGTGYFSEEGYPYLDKIMAAAKKYWQAASCSQRRLLGTIRALILCAACSPHSSSLSTDKNASVGIETVPS